MKPAGLSMRTACRLVWFVLTAGAAFATPLAAQAPVITADGDPSIASDTIYKLAVDSAAYPEQSTVLLLDDGVVKIEADGSARRTFRQVVQILRDRAVANYQERQFSYEPGRERLTINWIHVLKPNGEVISSKPSHTQESDLPASLVNPVYIHRRVIRESLTGVAPGTLVDMSWTIADTTPYRPGDFYQSWSVMGGTTVRRSRFLVDAPKGMKLGITERRLNFVRRETVTGDRRTYVWATQEVPWIKPETFAPAADSDGISMGVAVATPGSWSDIGRWYAALASDRQRANTNMRDTIRVLMAHAVTHDDSIRAIHRWVAQDIRYVSIALGRGGYQPRMPDTVIATGFGDCKDKATLFIAALRLIGVEAYPVLLLAGGHPDRALPTIGAFNHEIAAIKRASGYEFVDLTSDISPLGTLPYADEGEFVLIVHPDGRTEETTTPPDPVDANRTDVRLAGTLSTTGLFNGRFEMRGTGLGELALRATLRSKLDSTQRATFMRTVASGVFPGAKGDSLVTFDGKDLSAQARIALVIRDGQATQQSGETDILVLHDMSSARMTQVADALAAEGPRRLPLDAGQIQGPVTAATETRITLPDGWHARLPPNVSASSVFGTFSATYSQDGRDLVITHRTVGTRGVFPKERAPELIAWLRQIGTDRVAFIVLDHHLEPHA